MNSAFVLWLSSFCRCCSVCKARKFVANKRPKTIFISLDWEDDWVKVAGGEAEWQDCQRGVLFSYACCVLFCSSAFAELPALPGLPAFSDAAKGEMVASRPWSCLATSSPGSGM